MKEADIKRFWSKVNKKRPYECWPWLGKARCGKHWNYGQFWLEGKNATPHRISYELAYGDFDRSLHVLHHCDDGLCVNPAHLFTGTNADNIADKMRKGRWKGGHPKFVPGVCADCGRMAQIVKTRCKTCYGRHRHRRRRSSLR